MSLFFLLPPGHSNTITYTLTGTSGSPTTQTHLSIQPDVANVKWSITALTGANNTIKGYVQHDEYDSGDAVVFANQHSFRSPSDGWTTLYVRLTADSGVADSTTHAIDGTTWHTLTEDGSNIQWTETHDDATPESCVVKVEMCTVGDGSNIVATGYYKSTVSAEL